MTEWLREELLSLAQAARLIPSRPHVSTLWRWCGRGVRGVRLRTVIVGGRRYTTAAYVADFVAELSASPEAAPAVPAGRARQISSASARAAEVF